MRLSRVFVEELLIVGSGIELDASRRHYVGKVLRLKAGDKVALFNGQSDSDYHAVLESDGKRLLANIHSKQESKTESCLGSEIIQALSRGDHLDLAIQKCTELGVGKLSIFNADRSQIPLKPKQQERRFARWRAISINACEQCGRHIPPAIEFYPSLGELLDIEAIRRHKLMLDFDGVPLGDYLSNIAKDGKVSLLLGPEGGLSEQEIKAARANSFTAVGLGPRVLRTETAAIAALAIMQAYWGDLST
ncbi:MAG: 16S rRNA (uracil(1498)-N(3))-methyltransferase [Gammaproteobacteria bacterium]|nr:16S rRNA (uracil(1498)-N(3))-methyltransferase [Gammaproteobacteria bacterium]